ncbi:MAG TPA: hypothetical protein VLU54_16725 [Casimicrobiaceae bacterium]|nr:hypothetical protein [Casimicrobiaceae bacterium]
MNELHLATTPEPEHESSDWLRRLSPMEWIRAALGELSRANDALSRGQARAAIAGCKRGAGMALNGALLVAPNAAWGRTYLEHLAALAYDSTVPKSVREACGAVLRARAADADVVDKAYDVIAHAWFVVQRSERPR